LSFNNRIEELEVDDEATKYEKINAAVVSDLLSMKKEVE